MALDVGQLFERYHGVVYRRCLSLLNDPEDAAEAVQDVFEGALAGLGRFRLQSSPLTWLYAIATRHCLQLSRNRRSRQLAQLLLPRASDVAPDAAGSRTDLERVLERLGRDDQELTVYAFRDGLTQQEIADVLRLSRKTVGRRLRALQARLTRALGSEAPVGVGQAAW